MAMREYILKLATSRYVMCYCRINSILTLLSFSSRLNSELDISVSLRIIGDIELQKLGVVPQTVFLRARNAPSEYVSRASRLSAVITASTGPRVSTYFPGRTQLMSPRKPNRLSIDMTSTTSNSGTAFEDLRRRLATINDSTSSLATAHRPTPTSQDAKNAISPVPTSNTPPVSATSIIPPPSPSVSSVAIPHPVFPGPTTPSTTSTIDRPGSPAESIVSTANSLRPLSRMQLSGSVILDGAKAAPAVGSSKTNAVGLLEAHSKFLRDTEGSPERSEGSLSFSVANAMRPHRSRQPSLQPISTYGTLIYHSRAIYCFLMFE